MNVATAVLAAVLAAPAPAPLDAAAQTLTDGFAQALVDALCTTPAQIAEASTRLRTERPDLSEAEVAAFEARVAVSAPELSAACARRVREAAGAEEGPVASYQQRLHAALGSGLAPKEVAQLHAFLETPAGRHAEAARRGIDAEAYLRASAWARQFAPALYDELGMMMRADIGPLPPKPAAPAAPAGPSVAALPRARLRNVADLGRGCESFYPPSARRDGDEGSVVLLVRIGTRGRLEGILVESSSGHPALDVAAAACIGALAQFEPPQQDGVAIATWQRLKWTWRLDD